MISLLVATILAISQPTSGLPEKAEIVQKFLRTFAVSPVESWKFVTKDAVMAIGDIGGPFNDYVKLIKRREWLQGCDIARIEPMPISQEQLQGPDMDPALKKGAISAFRGAYSCPGPDGSKREVEFTTILRDDRILQLFLGGSR